MMRLQQGSGPWSYQAYTTKPRSVGSVGYKKS
jgi:hypothetical protein